MDGFCRMGTTGESCNPAANVQCEATASAMAQNVTDGITHHVRLADSFIAYPPLARRAERSAPVSPAPQVEQPLLRGKMPFDITEFKAFMP